MSYNPYIWEKYTDDNEASFQDELAKFIYHITIALSAQRICEVGCNIGNNLTCFPSTYDIHGIDLSNHALEKAREKHPSFKFKQESVANISYPDSYFDLVFTRGVLIHIPENEVDIVLRQLVRISKKWIFNLEYFGKDGEMIKWKRGDNLLWYRNMKERWSKFDVEIISDVDIPSDIDSGKMRFTLIRKK